MYSTTVQSPSQTHQKHHIPVSGPAKSVQVIDALSFSAGPRWGRQQGRLY